MKLFKKAILPLALSAILLFSACSSSNGISAQSATEETTSISSVISETSSVATTTIALSEETSESSEQTTITSSEETSSTSSGTKPSNEKMYVHFIDVDQGDSIFIELPNMSCYNKVVTSLSKVI